jgi:sugar diacid utilization regulator
VTASSHRPGAPDLIRTFAAISASLNLRQPLVTTLDLIAEQVARTLGHGFCAIVMHEEQTGAFSIRGSYGLSPQYVHLANELVQQQIDRDGIARVSSPTVRAFRSRLPTQVHDITTDHAFDDWRELAELAGYSSAVFMPLVFRDEPIGVLCCYDRARTYSPEDVDSLKPVAEQTATAVGIARLLDRQQGVIEALKVTTRELDQRNAMLGRAAEATRTLTQLLLRHCSLEELVAELHLWLGSPVAVCDDHMHELARSASASRQATDSSTEIVASVNGPDAAYGYLLVECSDADAEAAARPLLEPSAMACALYFMREQAAFERELRVASQLLYDLVNGEGTAVETQLLARRLRLDEDTDYRILTVTPIGMRDTDTARARRRIQAVTRALRQVDSYPHGVRPVVHAVLGLAVVAVVPATGDPEKLAAAVHDVLADTAPGAYHGVALSRPCRRSTDFRRRYQELRRCQDLAGRTAGGDLTVVVEHWHLHSMLMRSSEDADIRERSHELLDPLLADPTGERLLESIRIYLDSGAHIARTASALRVHPNTVKYRLRKVERQTGLSFERMLDLMDLQVAIMIRDLDPTRYNAESRVAP